MLLKISIEKLLSETSYGRSSELRDACQAALDRLKTEKVTSEAPVAAPPAAVVVGQSAALAGQAPQGAPEAQIKSATPASLASSTAINADQYWPPFKLALQNPNPKIVETALDCVQKLVAHRFLQGSLVDPTTGKLLIDSIVELVANAFTVAKDDPNVQLQVVKALLTIITAPSCEVHDVSLLRAVQTCFNIFLFSKNVVNQVTAKASLTQIVNLVFQRMERYAVSVVNRAADQRLRQESEEAKTTQTAAANGTEQAEGDGAAEAGKYGFCVVCHKRADNYCSQTKDPVCSKACKMANLERIEAEEKRRLEDASFTSSAADGDAHHAPAAKNSDWVNPYDPTVAAYGRILRKDVYLVFKRLCVLSKAPDDVDAAASADSSNNETRGRMLALELLLSVLSHPGPVFRSNENFVNLIRKELCLNLSKNAISAHNTIFELTLSIFLTLLTHFKAPLKREIQILFKDTFLRILHQPSTSAAQRIMVLQGLAKVCSNAQALIDIYINYDCDVNADDLYETMVNEVATAASSAKALDLMDAASAKKFRLRSLQCAVAIINSLLEWSNKEDAGNSSSATIGNASVDERSTAGTPPNDQPVILDKNPLGKVTVSAAAPDPSAVRVDSPEQFEEMKSRKLLLRQGVEKFNEKPKKGVAFLQESKFLGTTPEDVATFLLKTPSLNKAAIGEYLGEGDAENIRVMHAFVDQMAFTDMAFTAALRHFLQAFRLPGESQKIDRLMEKYADRYCENNPKVFANADTAYTLAFSVIMLNTDLHSAQIKNKMTKPQFLRNNRGINNGGDLEEAYLGAIYDDIASNEIVMEEEQSQELSKTSAGELTAQMRSDLYKMEVGQLTRKLQNLLKSQTSKDIYHYATHLDHIRPMFTIAWMPILTTLSIAFEGCDDPDGDVAKTALDGFSGAVRISCRFALETERETFIQALAKFTLLNNVAELRVKHVEAIRTLLNISLSSGNYLNESWTHVMHCISRLEQLQLLAQISYEELESSLRRAAAEQQVANPAAAAAAAPVAIPRDPLTKSQMEAVMNEFQSQTFILAVDRIFSSSAALSGAAVVHFFSSLCKVSLEEVDEQPKPRMFSLQKVVELTTYNMNRIRLEWTPIWHGLQAYFNTVGCHTNQNVATFAVDSLRQLAMKFLEREELAHYHTQNEFLKPFEHIIKQNRMFAIRDFVLKSVEQMIRARHRNLRSGWRSIFVVLSRAAAEPSIDLVGSAFALVQMVYNEYFEYSLGSFNDFVYCLGQVAFNQVSEDISLSAIYLLQTCAMHVNVRAVSQAVASMAHQQQAGGGLDEFFLRWFPILSELSRIVIDANSLAVRKKALDTMFTLLHASGSTFTADNWRMLFRSVLQPIFEDFQDPESKKTDVPSTIWVQALALEVELFNVFFDALVSTSVLDMVLDLVLSFTVQKNENLAKTGVLCLQKLITKNARGFREPEWTRVTDLLQQAFERTAPVELAQPPTKEFDFAKILIKVAVHLELIKCLRDVATVEVLECVPASSWSRWLQLLKQSFQFAARFNENYDLRFALVTAGFVVKVPTLNQQETVALTAYLLVSFRLYRLYGNSEVELERPLVAECLDYMSNFNALLLDGKKNEREISMRSPIVVTILQELQSVDWGTIPGASGLAQYMPELHRAVVAMLIVESVPLRRVLQSFLMQFARCVFGTGEAVPPVAVEISARTLTPVPPSNDLAAAEHIEAAAVVNETPAVEETAETAANGDAVVANGEAVVANGDAQEEAKGASADEEAHEAADTEDLR